MRLERPSALVRRTRSPSVPVRSWSPHQGRRCTVPARRDGYYESWRGVEEEYAQGGRPKPCGLGRSALAADVNQPAHDRVEGGEDADQVDPGGQRHEDSGAERRSLGPGGPETQVSGPDSAADGIEQLEPRLSRLRQHEGENGDLPRWIRSYLNRSERSAVHIDRG